jgi:quercetin dioxygenase-like cupin family protein
LAAEVAGEPGTPAAAGAGEVGTRLLYENGRVKVWEFALDPGEAIPMHTHTMDYLFHVYQGSTLEVSYPAETEAPPNKIDLKAGEVRFIAKGGRHTARNVGSQRYVEVLVELKA